MIKNWILYSDNIIRNFVKERDQLVREEERSFSGGREISEEESKEKL